MTAMTTIRCTKRFISECFLKIVKRIVKNLNVLGLKLIGKKRKYGKKGCFYKGIAH